MSEFGSRPRLSLTAHSRGRAAWPAGAMMKKACTSATDALFTYETVAVSKVRHGSR